MSPSGIFSVTNRLGAARQRPADRPLQANQRSTKRDRVCAVRAANCRPGGVVATTRLVAIARRELGEMTWTVIKAGCALSQDTASRFVSKKRSMTIAFRCADV